MTMRKFLPLLAAATAAAALATGCVTNGAITTLDLTDTNGETLQSVSEWDPGESHTYSMPALPDGCEVNIVSSDPSLLSAELSEGTLTLTAENAGKAILTVEVALDGNTFSKSYEVQISDRKLQVGVTLIDSRAIADPNDLEDSYRPAQPSLGGAVFADNFLELLNPDSLKVLKGCKVEPGLSAAKPGESFQFMRQGYFCADNRDSSAEHLVFNRSVSLKDSFKK